MESWGQEVCECTTQIHFAKLLSGSIVLIKHLPAVHGEGPFLTFLQTSSMIRKLSQCDFFLSEEFSRIKQASKGDFRKQMYSSKHSNEETLICLDTDLTLHQDKSMQQNKLSWLWFRTRFEMPGMKQIKWENQRRWGLWKHKEQYQTQHKCLKVYN